MFISPECMIWHYICIKFQSQPSLNYDKTQTAWKAKLRIHGITFHHKKHKMEGKVGARRVSSHKMEPQFLIFNPQPTWLTIINTSHAQSMSLQLIYPKLSRCFLGHFVDHFWAPRQLIQLFLDELKDYLQSTNRVYYHVRSTG